ncbi:2-deoxystreptamine glucosyltransferase [Arthrobacter sp. Hiyo4]|nr:2-deoxystreptamine glucosyltransferase [Arthrobacter sp. Hiyo4]
MMSIAGIILGRIKRVQTTMYVLDLWPENLFSVLQVENQLARRLATAVSHWHYRHVDKLVVLSNLMKKRVLEASRLDQDKVAVLPQACEKFYEADVVDASLAERFSGRFNVVFTGNISPAQSFETMIDAAELLRDQGHRQVRWIIVGDGMSRREIEVAVEARGLGDCFEFVGQVPPEEIPAYTTLADVLVGCLVKSDLLEATIPAKVLSYVAAGRPVVLAMDGEVGTSSGRRLADSSVLPAMPRRWLRTSRRSCRFQSPRDDSWASTPAVTTSSTWSETSYSAGWSISC